ncbi:MAG: hypothetical protein QOJ00_2359 [Actinomycetota bacterium]
MRKLIISVAVLALLAVAPLVRASYTVVPPGGGPHVRIFNGDGTATGGFFAYEPTFGGGVTVAIGDVTGDAQPEVVTGAGPSGAPVVKVYSLAGDQLASWNAYGADFAGGVSVAVADVVAGGKKEIVTGAGFGGGPHVRVFDANGSVQREWMAYDPAFTGGVRVAAGAVDTSGGDRVVTAPLSLGGPHVRVFNGDGGVTAEWMAYDPAFNGGVNVGAGGGHVVTAPASHGGPHVRVFNGSGGVTAEWMAYDPSFSGGVQVAAGTVDGADAIVTGAGPGGGPHVRVFTPSGNERSGFFAYDTSYAGGVNVAAGDGHVVTGAGVARVVEVLDVASVQQRLLSMGFWLPSVNGSLDSNTTQAIYAFQKANGLPRDGKIGPEDQPALNAGNRPSPISSSGNLVEVDKARQLLFVVRNGGAQWVFNTSTGSEKNYTYDGHTYVAHTPEGRFTFDRQIDGTRVSHLGELYRPKYFTSAGHAIHGSPSIPPYPASHGCVRLSNAAIDYIWDAGLAPLGSPIWVHA